MRKITVLIVIISVFGMISFVDAQQNVLMPNNLRVVDRVVAYTTIYPNYFEWEAGVKPLDSLVSRAIQGKIPVYLPVIWEDYFPYQFTEKIATSDEIVSNMDGSPKKVIITEGDGKIKEAIMVGSIRFEDLRQIRFIEDWVFDEQDFRFQKKIVALEPIREFYRAEDLNREEMLKRLVISHRIDKMTTEQVTEAKKRMVLCAKMVNEFNFYSDKEKFYPNQDAWLQEVSGYERDGAPFLNSYNRLKFLEVLINRIKSRKNKIFDFYTNKTIDFSEFENNLGAGDKTIIIENTVSGELMEKKVHNQIDMKSIKSVYFMEELWYDPITFYFEKKVIGIAPVQYSYNTEDYDQKNLIKKIPGVIYFDDKPMNYSYKNLNLSGNTKADSILNSEVSRFKDVETLDVSKCSIKEFPSGILLMTKLKTLNLSSNQLKDIPETISQLAQLREINIKGNDITKLPKSMGSFKNLETIQLTASKIQNLEVLFSVISLKKLNLSGAQNLKMAGISKMKNLESLMLNDCNLAEFPSEISKLAKLQNLSVMNNQIKKIPTSLFNSKSLQVLDLSANQLTAIPSEIGKLKGLGEANFNYNPITKLPESLKMLKQIYSFSCINFELPEADRDSVKMWLPKNCRTNLYGAFLENYKPYSELDSVQFKASTRLVTNSKALSISSFIVSATIKGYTMECRSSSYLLTAEQKRLINSIEKGTKIYFEAIRAINNKGETMDLEAVVYKKK